MLSSIGRRGKIHELSAAPAPLPLNFLILKGYCVVIEMRLGVWRTCGDNSMQYRKDSDKAGRDARGKKYNGSARYSLPQIKTYFKHSVSEKGGPGDIPRRTLGTFLLWKVPRAGARNIPKQIDNPQFLHIRPLFIKTSIFLN